MTPTDIAAHTIATNYTRHWDITILVSWGLFVCHIEDMDVATMLALTISDYESGTHKPKLRGMCKDAKRNAPKMLQVAQMYGKVERICSRKEFLNMCDWAKANHNRNAGETAEQLLRDFYGLPMYWYKDSTPGTVAGDMVVNDIHIQHKHQNGTFAH